MKIYLVSFSNKLCATQFSFCFTLVTSVPHYKLYNGARTLIINNHNYSGIPFDVYKNEKASKHKPQHKNSRHRCYRHFPTPRNNWTRECSLCCPHVGQGIAGMQVRTLQVGCVISLWNIKR